MGSIAIDGPRRWVASGATPGGGNTPANPRAQSLRARAVPRHDRAPQVWRALLPAPAADLPGIPGSAGARRGGLLCSLPAAKARLGQAWSSLVRWPLLLAPVLVISGVVAAVVLHRQAPVFAPAAVAPTVTVGAVDAGLSDEEVFAASMARLAEARRRAEGELAAVRDAGPVPGGRRAGCRGATAGARRRGGTTRPT